MPTKKAGLPEPDQRSEILVQQRNLKMARSAHAYVRGSTARFYEWLDQSTGKIPAGPSIWICGDCHVGNLGPLADSDAHVDIQIRDLDQTVDRQPGARFDQAWLVARLGGARLGFAGRHDGPYARGNYRWRSRGPYRRFEDEHDGKAHRPKPVQLVLEQALKRRWRHLAEERIEDVKRRQSLSAEPFGTFDANGCYRLATSE